MNQPHELQKNIRDLVVKAREVEITNSQDLSFAGGFLAACDQRLGEINAAFDGIIKKNHEAWKNALNVKKVHAEPVERAKAMIGQKVSQYRIEQDRIAQQKAEEAARIDREKADKEKEAEAAQVAAEGFKEEAEAIRQEERPLTIATPAEPEEPKAPEGYTFQDVWHIEVINLKQLIAEAPEYVIQDQKALNAQVRARKANCRIPGCKVWAEKKTKKKPGPRTSK